MAFLTMWNASAISASEPTATPTPSSRMKKVASIASMTMIRVDFDHAMLKNGFRVLLETVFGWLLDLGFEVFLLRAMAGLR